MTEDAESILTPEQNCPKCGTVADPAPASWQPIETAPKDGTRLLGHWSPIQPGAAEAVDVVCWCDGNWCDPDDTGAHYGPPTHWQPLPAPPSVSSPTEPDPELTPAQVFIINDMIHAWIDRDKKGEFRQAFRNDCKRLLATAYSLSSPTEPDR